jgi:hypothetical protein
MRFAYAALLAAGLASPAMAQSVTIQGPHPAAAAADAHASHTARVEQRMNSRDARVDENVAHRDAAHGNYLGAAQAQQDARLNMGQARQDAGVANRDAARARNQDSTHVTITP